MNRAITHLHRVSFGLVATCEDGTVWTITDEWMDTPPACMDGTDRAGYLDSSGVIIHEWEI